jgi:uncharacterized protein (DUF488 family)
MPGSPTRPKVFTIGYAAHTPTTLIDRIKTTGVEVMLDVRELPLSRRPGFSKSVLAKAAEDRGVEYRHFKSLGVPSLLRKRRKLGELDGPAYMDAFRHLLRQKPDVLADALRLVETRQCCLLCLERHPADCHRTVVAEELDRVSPHGVAIEHL